MTAFLQFPVKKTKMCIRDRYDDIAYGESLGTTAKFPRNAFAFKWADEQKETTLLEIEWSPSRTGLINPVAVFEPVELEGTSVSRASVHNISIMRSLDLGAVSYTHLDVYKRQEQVNICPVYK